MPFPGGGYGLVDIGVYDKFDNNLGMKFTAFNLLDKQYARRANIQGLKVDSSAITNL